MHLSRCSLTRSLSSLPLTALLLTVTGFLSLTGVRAASAEEAKRLSAGAASVDITPDYPIRLSGYGGRTKNSEGVDQRLFAKALAFGEDEKTASVLLTVDNVGVPASVTEAVYFRVAARTGLKRENFALCSSHTHTGPMLTGVLSNLFGADLTPEEQKTIDQYTAELTEKLTRLSLEALQNRKPAAVSWGEGRAGFAQNRRTPGGPVDHSLPVLAVRDPDGTLRAVLANYACHCTTMGGEHNKFCADWAGYAQASIEEAHPGAVALVSIGCGADANPQPRTGLAFAQQHGRAIAEEVSRLLKTDLKPLAHSPAGRLKNFELPFDKLPSREQWEEHAKTPGAIGYHARKNLDRLNRGETLPQALPYSVQTWSFGPDMAMVFLPGEVVVDYALRLKSEHQNLWVNAYANDVPCYIPSKRILAEGGYEAEGAMIYYDRPARLGPDTEELITAAVHEIMPEEFHVKKMEGAPPPVSAEDSLSKIKVKPGFKVELAAAEPQVVDPVAIDFGPDGKLWVVEMHDYPLGMDGKGKAGGRVKVLEDADGDGRFEKATIFLDKLSYPTGLLVWRKGVLVCAAPDILYAEDTDGDGKADKVEKLFTGFATENYQARVNGLSLGLDGWIYGANGLLGGLITGKNGDTPVDVRGRDFRMNPDTGAFEPATGQTQQGRVRDDFGNWFGSDNSTLAWHYPMAEHYLKRNPDIVPPALRVYVSSGPENNRVYPASETLERFNDPQSANRATAACGGDFYRDTLWGEEFYGDYFVNESVHNLTTRMKLKPEGVTFSGRRARDERESEFFASEDNWARPVQVKTGPDGALWVVDMYRYVIEHPRWIPAEQLAKLDVRAGADKGRIYRVYPEGKPLRKMPDLTKMNPADLAAALDTPNGIQRDLIQTQLTQRGDASAVPVLARLAKESALPAVRVQALAALNGLKALTPEILAPALADAHPGVRVNALKMSEPFFNQAPALGAAALALKADPDFRVRWQLALSLGEWNDPKARRALGELALTAMDDAWMRTAVLTSCTANPGEVLEVILSTSPQGGDAAEEGRGELTGGLIAAAVASGGEDAAGKVIAALVSGNAAGEAWRFTAWAALLDALSRKGTPAEKLISSVAENAELAPKVDQVFTAAGVLAFEETAAPPLREAALRLSGFRSGQAEDYWQKVVALFDSSASQPLKTAALEVLRRGTQPRLAELLLQNWTVRAPAVRAAFMELLLSRPEWSGQLLNSLESEAVSATEVTAPNRDRLLKHSDEAIRGRAEKVFAAFQPQRRAEVLAAYKTVRDLRGDVRSGAEIFKVNCGICHSVNGIGTTVGPDIALFRDKGVQEYLEAILDPNAIIEPRFITWVVEMKDGRTLAGLVSNETTGSLTLVQPGGLREDVLRSGIREMRASPLSLMPEGLEQSLPPQQMADLIAWLKTGGPKKFGGATAAETAAARGEFQKMKPDGAAKVTAAPEVLDYMSWMGPLTFVACRQTDGNSRLAWETAPAPESLEAEGSQTFRFAGGLGFVSQPEGVFALELNGNKVLEFGVTLNDHTWSSEDGAVRLSYEAKENNVEDSSGLFTLEVRNPLLTPGKPAALEVTGSAAGGMRWFGIYLLSPKALALAPEPADDTPLSGRLLINDRRPASQREAIIAKYPERSAEFLKDMTADLTPGTPEEYRRIPWIWRVTVAAGRRGETGELRDLLEASLPKDGQPLTDWQAVVIGGGIINGISMAGPWPGARIDEIIAEDAALRARWTRALKLSEIMAEDEKVPHGTRYDALRMIPLLPWETCRAQLVKYLAKDAHPELQQGAVSGLADVDHPEAAALLIEHFTGLTEGNKSFALDALLRDPKRMEMLLDAIEANKIPAAALGKERLQRLTGAEDPALRGRAEKLPASP